MTDVDAHTCPQCGCKAWTVDLVTFTSGEIGLDRLICRDCGFEDDVVGAGTFIKRLQETEQ